MEHMNRAEYSGTPVRATGPRWGSSSKELNDINEDGYLPAAGCDTVCVPTTWNTHVRLYSSRRARRHTLVLCETNSHGDMVVLNPNTQAFVWCFVGGLPIQISYSAGVSATPPAFTSPLFSFNVVALTDHGRASGKSSLRPLSKVVHGCGSTVRHLEVGVDVDAAGDHHLPIGLYGFHPTRYDQVVADLPVKSRRSCQPCVCLNWCHYATQ